MIDILFLGREAMRFLPRTTPDQEKKSPLTAKAMINSIQKIVDKDYKTKKNTCINQLQYIFQWTDIERYRE